MEITHVPYRQIDREKWSDCLNNAANGSLYATTEYLDAIAGKWDALIQGDYETIMPLIFKSKAGVKYLYQPPFLPQTGIFSRHTVDEETLHGFLGKAFSLYPFAEISLVYPLRAKVFGRNMTLKQRNNFIVDLHPAYDRLFGNYTPAFTKSLRRLQKLSLQYRKGEDIEAVTGLFRSLYPQKITGVTPSGISKFNDACAALQEDKRVFIRKAYSEDGQLLCAVILLQFSNRLYNMMSCITAAGKKAEANYFLYDRIIEEFAGKGMILDLEGSDIKGIADFYRKMNPVNEAYTFIRYNNLPWPIKILKQ